MPGFPLIAAVAPGSRRWLNVMAKSGTRGRARALNRAAPTLVQTECAHTMFDEAYFQDICGHLTFVASSGSLLT